jgi:hypothetical protein
MEDTDEFLQQAQVSLITSQGDLTNYLKEINIQLGDAFYKNCVLLDNLSLLVNTDVNRFNSARRQVHNDEPKTSDLTGGNYYYGRSSGSSYGGSAQIGIENRMAYACGISKYI